MLGDLARYVLVDARDETEARSLGRDALHDRYADLRERFSRDIPIEIQPVRPAIDAEIDLWQFHQGMLREDENALRQRTMIRGQSIHLVANGEKNSPPVSAVREISGLNSTGEPISSSCPASMILAVTNLPHCSSISASTKGS
jgi:hypothetical protein